MLAALATAVRGMDCMLVPDTEFEGIDWTATASHSFAMSSTGLTHFEAAKEEVLEVAVDQAVGREGTPLDLEAACLHVHFSSSGRR